MNIVWGILLFVLGSGFVAWAYIAAGNQRDKHITEEVEKGRAFAYKAKGIIPLYFFAVLCFLAGASFLLNWH